MSRATAPPDAVCRTVCVIWTSAQCYSQPDPYPRQSESAVRNRVAGPSNAREHPPEKSRAQRVYLRDHLPRAVAALRRKRSTPSKAPGILIDPGIARFTEEIVSAIAFAPRPQGPVTGGLPRTCGSDGCSPGAVNYSVRVIILCGCGERVRRGKQRKQNGGAVDHGFTRARNAMERRRDRSATSTLARLYLTSDVFCRNRQTDFRWETFRCQTSWLSEKNKASISGGQS